MQAYEIPNLRFSALAGAVLPKRRFVTINSSEKAVLPSAGGRIIGVTANVVDVVDAIDEVVNIYDGIVMVAADGNVTAGSLVETNQYGGAITNDEGIAVGIAMTSAVAGGVVTVKIG